MAAPKIKIHQLPDGYSEANDTDIQQRTDDELLPYVPKPELLGSAYLLTGIIHVTNASLIPLAVSTGRNSFNLSPNAATLQTPTGIAMTDVVIGPSGELELRVLDSGNTPITPWDGVGPSGWRVHYTANAPDAIEFLTEPPSGAKISCWSKNATPHNQWALSNSGAYDGLNPAFNTIYLTTNNGAVIPVSASGETQQYVVTPSGYTAVTADFWYESRIAKDFCGNHNNWIGSHYEMWPDIFVGEINYPGDSYTPPSPPNAPPIDPGVLPAYREVGTYQINFRDGMVSFPEEIDQDAVDINLISTGLVRALYAYLKGVGNVTGQRLDGVVGTDGKGFRANTETRFPASHGKRWVTRADTYLPRNIYVNGVLTPVPLHRTGDVLTIKTS